MLEANLLLLSVYLGHIFITNASYEPVWCCMEGEKLLGKKCYPLDFHCKLNPNSSHKIGLHTGRNKDIGEGLNSFIYVYTMAI